MSKYHIFRSSDGMCHHQTDEGTLSSPDFDRYRHHVAHLDLPEERKTEMMLAVWWMMQSFVDRAFGHDPVQRSGCLAGKRYAVDEVSALPVIDCPTDVSDDESLSEKFHHHANGAKNKEKR